MDWKASEFKKKTALKCDMAQLSSPALAELNRSLKLLI